MEVTAQSFAKLVLSEISNAWRMRQQSARSTGMAITAVYFVSQQKINLTVFHVQKVDEKFAISIGMESNVIFTAKLLIQVIAMKTAIKYATRAGMVLTVLDIAYHHQMMLRDIFVMLVVIKYARQDGMDQIAEFTVDVSKAQRIQLGITVIR